MLRSPLTPLALAHGSAVRMVTVPSAALMMASLGTLLTADAGKVSR